MVESIQVDPLPHQGTRKRRIWPRLCKSKNFAQYITFLGTLFNSWVSFSRMSTMLLPHFSILVVTVVFFSQSPFIIVAAVLSVIMISLTILHRIMSLNTSRLVIIPIARASIPRISPLSSNWTKISRISPWSIVLANS